MSAFLPLATNDRQKNDFFSDAPRVMNNYCRQSYLGQRYQHLFGFVSYFPAIFQVLHAPIIRRYLSLANDCCECWAQVSFGIAPLTASLVKRSARPSFPAPSKLIYRSTNQRCASVPSPANNGKNEFKTYSLGVIQLFTDVLKQPPQPLFICCRNQPKMAEFQVLIKP
jgi:hypothetical protein